MSALHHEIPVKVTAWVDEGIAPLVAALNDLGNVCTVASCEDDQSELSLGAYVMFTHEGQAAEAVNLAVALATGLGEDAPPYRLQADWRSGEGKPLLTLSCPPDQVRELARAVSDSPMRLSAGGTGCTAPRSSIASPTLRPTST